MDAGMITTKRGQVKSYADWNTEDGGSRSAAEAPTPPLVFILYRAETE